MRNISKSKLQHGFNVLSDIFGLVSWASGLEDDIIRVSTILGF